MNEGHEFGPFTPQELESVVDWLQAEGLQFEISKDQRTEDLFRLNDGNNVVQQVEFRTQIYLAQIFSVKVVDMSVEQLSRFNKKFRLSEKIPQEFMQNQFDGVDYPRMMSQKTKKMIWAWIMTLIFLVPMLLSFYKILFKGE